MSIFPYLYIYISTVQMEERDRWEAVSNPGTFLGTLGTPTLARAPYI